MLLGIDLANRGEEANIPVHVINVEIKDNHEDALVGGRAISQLAQMVRFSFQQTNCYIENDPSLAYLIHSLLDRKPAD